MKTIIRICTILVVALLASITCTAQIDRAYLIDRASKSEYGQSNAEEAIKICNKMLAENPNDSIFYELRGLGYAKIATNNMIASDSNYVMAINDLKKATLLYPKSLTAHKALFNLYLNFCDKHYNNPCVNWLYCMPLDRFLTLLADCRTEIDFIYSIDKQQASKSARIKMVNDLEFKKTF